MAKATEEQIAKLTELLPKCNSGTMHERKAAKTYVLQILKDIDKDSSFYIELDKLVSERTELYFPAVLKSAIEYYSPIKD